MIRMEAGAMVEAQAGSLPSLIDKARQSLANAKGAAAVLEIHETAAALMEIAKRQARMAKLEAAHDEVIAAVHRSQGYALELKAQASRRYHEETKAAIERQEIPGRGGDHGNQHTGGKLLDEKFANPEKHHAVAHAGKQIAEAENASPGIVAASIAEIVESGEAPTQAALMRKIDADLEDRAKDDAAARAPDLDDIQFKKFRKKFGPAFKALRPGAQKLFIAWVNS